MKTKTRKRRTRRNRKKTPIIITIVVLVVYALLHFDNIKANFEKLINSKNSISQSGDTKEIKNKNSLELSRSKYDTQIIEHDYFTIGYNHNSLQANWVAYYLSSANLLNPVTSRSEDFREDEAVRGTRATLSDYRGSGFDRGHLAPAADFKFSKSAMSDTFLLSNMSPQIHSYNAGIWADLESLVRNIAKKEGDVYVVTGPIFYKENKKRQTIGANKIPIPDAYYKVLLVYNDNTKKAIGFIINHDEEENSALSSYAMCVDDIEKISNIDFFYNLSDDEEELIESDFDTKKWLFKKNQS